MEVCCAGTGVRGRAWHLIMHVWIWQLHRAFSGLQGLPGQNLGGLQGSPGGQNGSKLHGSRLDRMGVVGPFIKDQC
eukprot:1136471-Pelagomonas_calceolata.AAC.2